ncbi:hypothetical protein SAMN05446635_0224 [Burkholderia sp. OK233]|nr:hypothetical protein SAMN05446635_0224 [Burkholderia sp. OK233]
MAAPRDDFSQSTKEILAKRSGQCCSNPDCGRVTSGPHEDDDKAVNLGVAAHITAAAPGGPRYYEKLARTERSSIGNAIWLCQSCAKLVDSDVRRFPEELLVIWKRKHEERTKRKMTGIDVSSGALESGTLNISAIYAHPSGDNLACIVDVRVSNPGRTDILINAIEFEVLEFLRKFPLGKASFSATYDIDISETIEYMAKAECQVAQILKPGEADRFAIALSATSLAAVCACWKFAVRLKTNYGVFRGPDIELMIPAGEPDLTVDAVRRLLKEKVVGQLSKHADHLERNPDDRQYIVNPRPGPYGGFTTMMAESLFEYSGPLSILDMG